MSTSETEIKRHLSEADKGEILEPAWEIFERTERVTSERLRVAEGWFIRSWYKESLAGEETEISTFFYPDENHAWSLKISG